MAVLLARWVVRGAAVASLAFAPRALAGGEADKWFDGDLATQDALAREVASEIRKQAAPVIKLGAPRFEGEWALVAYQMTILGLGQMILEHPELRERYVPVMEDAAARMMRPAQRDFATRAWGSDGMQALGSARGDAWLGWPDVALSMLRLVNPQTKTAAQNDAITEALVRRLSAAPRAVIETYPRESYPTDVAACVAAIALHARATGKDRSAFFAKWTPAYRANWIDGASRYVVQRGDAKTGARHDVPRGSGTAVAAYYLAFVDPKLAAELEAALRAHQRTLLGFAAIREYASPGGAGDVDSGPVVLGVSVAATGFGLGAARAAGDRDLFTGLYRTTETFGVASTRNGGTWFGAGGLFGNAVLLAQLTAPKGKEP